MRVSMAVFASNRLPRRRGGVCEARLLARRLPLCVGTRAHAGARHCAIRDRAAWRVLAVSGAARTSLQLARISVRAVAARLPDGSLHKKKQQTDRVALCLAAPFLGGRLAAAAVIGASSLPTLRCDGGYPFACTRAVRCAPAPSRARVNCVP